MTQSRDTCCWGNHCNRSQ